MRLFRESQLGILLSDKDAGFVTMPKSDVTKVMQTIVDGNSYRPHTLTLDILSEYWQRYAEVCQGVAHIFHPTVGLEGPSRNDAVGSRNRLYKALMSDSHVDKWQMVSRLDATIKSHKPQGEVVPRAIHASVRHPFLPGERFLARKIRENMVGLGHLLKDSGDFVAQITAPVFLPTDRVLKIDVKDFFMSGEHDVLVSCVKKLFRDRDEAFHIGELLEVILSAQFITYTGATQKYQVIHGSGQGRLSSGDISDAAFYKMVEDPVTLNPDFRRTFGLKYWNRFKDDIWCIIAGDTPVTKFMSILRSNSRFFKLQVEDLVTLSNLADRWIPFLDVEMTVEYRDGLVQFAYRPYRKPTSLWRPLSWSSCHLPSIHSSWPTSFLMRLARLSSTTAFREEAWLKFRNELRIMSPGHPGIDAMPVSISRRRNLKTPTSRMIVPYSHLWCESDFDKLLTKFDFSMESFSMPKVRTGYRLGGTHLFRLLKSQNYTW